MTKQLLLDLTYGTPNQACQYLHLSDTSWWIVPIVTILMIHLICIVVFRRGLTFYLARLLFHLEVAQRAFFFALQKNWTTEYKRQYQRVKTNQHTSSNNKLNSQEILSDKTDSITSTAYDAT